MPQHNVELTSNPAASVQVTLSSKGQCLASWQSGLSISNVMLQGVCMHKYQVHLFRDIRVGLRPPGELASGPAFVCASARLQLYCKNSDLCHL
jgi:hypothetical protein